MNPSRLVSALRFIAFDEYEALDPSISVRSYLEKLLQVQTDDFLPDVLIFRSTGELEDHWHVRIPIVSAEEIHGKAQLILSRLDGEFTSVIATSKN